MPEAAGKPEFSQSQDAFRETVRCFRVSLTGSLPQRGKAFEADGDGDEPARCFPITVPSGDVSFFIPAGMVMHRKEMKECIQTFFPVLHGLCHEVAAFDQYAARHQTAKYGPLFFIIAFFYGKNTGLFMAEQVSSGPAEGRQFLIQDFHKPILQGPAEPGNLNEERDFEMDSSFFYKGRSFKILSFFLQGIGSTDDRVSVIPGTAVHLQLTIMAGYSSTGETYGFHSVGG